MLGRLATYVIPSTAIAAAAFFLLGPGARRPAIGVRVRGVPLDGGSVVAWRLEGVRRLYGVDDAIALGDLRVEASAGGEPLQPWEGATGPDGIAEASLSSPAPLRSPIDIHVTRGGAVLANGRFALKHASASFFELAGLRGIASGDLRIRVDIPRGTLAAPFADALRVNVETAEMQPIPGIALVVAAPGAEITPEQATTDARGRATFKVKPLAHDVELTVTATDDLHHTGRWEGHLPIRPGAIWLDPSKFASLPGGGASQSTHRLALLSPAPRDRAYVSVIGEHGRVLGVEIPLAPDGSGFHAGEAAVELPARERLLYAIVAGDPSEQGAGTIAWPLVPPEGAVPVRTVELLVDGLPAAEAREGERAAAARRVGAMILALAGMLEVMLLLVQSRESQRRLEKHLASAMAAVAGAEAGAEPAADREAILRSARETPRVRTLAFVALVALAFAIVAAFMSIR